MTTLTDAHYEIIEGRCRDPFALLGRHPHPRGGIVVRIFRPHIARAWLLGFGRRPRVMRRIAGSDFFVCRVAAGDFSTPYRLRLEDGAGRRWEEEDPYRFPPMLGDLDLHLIGEGNHLEKYRLFGANPRTMLGVEGTGFAVWAPNAQRVSVIGDFNGWDGRIHPMRQRGSSGVWELFLPGVGTGALYKFEVRTCHGTVVEKADPYARQMEVRPKTACIVHDPTRYRWGDDRWMERRRMQGPPMEQPISIYEVHLGSWQRNTDGGFLDYRTLAHRLVEHCHRLGFTHIELLPITEHPFDGSWGYQTVGYFAPTSRFGTPDDFRYFVDYCHQHEIGVLLDWVPAHFPKDSFALARFDGTALYEHEDPRLGEHADWGTLIFNYGRNEVRNFLIASALSWLDCFHVDGLRVDAVASMLYLDYSRREGEWLPNRHGGRENLEAVEFLKQFNCLVHERFPGAITMAEESTSWPMVSRPVWLGGLGFTMKWNMGWMNDSLRYFSRDPIHRSFHHNELTFSMMYAFSENFILPFSHDEVVHGKGSMPGKMPGDDWQKFANLRALYGWQFTHPGKKLLFMGCEFGQWQEWNDDGPLAWEQTPHQPHAGLMRMIADLNRLYRTRPELHVNDFHERGFEWIDCNDAAQSVLSYLRRDNDGNALLVVLNLTPVVREGYRIGVPEPGCYREIFNSDSAIYGGGNIGNCGQVVSEPIAFMGRPHSLSLRLPPLSCLIFDREEG
ncbi:MAG: 1,4-alpha-glucan branching protein GlgB [Zetaproteobacteria bacterium]|nr:MAG: 1,4-alpha-glucan branching protein GlgB [Zetaproteobacteria bacterium]